jgi:hypothetical protein
MYNLAYYMYITYVDSYITCILPHILHILTNIFSTLHMTISIGFLFLINFYIYVCFEKKSTSFEMYSKTTTKKLRNLPRSFVSCDILSILAECHAVILLFHLNFGFCTLEAFWCNLIFHLSLCNIP